MSILIPVVQNRNLDAKCYHLRYLMINISKYVAYCSSLFKDKLMKDELLDTRVRHGYKI